MGSEQEMSAPYGPGAIGFADGAEQVVSAHSGDAPSRIGFTGTQHGVTEAQRYSLLFILAKRRIAGAVWMHNGDCVGADDTAGKIWRALGGAIHLHPPIIDRKRAFMNFEATEEPKPYLERNEDIVRTCCELIATPQEMFEQQRSGTWATIRYAQRMARTHTIIWPNGHIEQHTACDTDGSPKGRDAQQLDGEAATAGAEGIAQEPSA